MQDEWAKGRERAGKDAENPTLSRKPWLDLLHVACDIAELQSSSTAAEFSLDRNVGSLSECSLDLIMA